MHRLRELDTARTMMKAKTGQPKYHGIDSQENALSRARGIKQTGGTSQQFS